MDRRDFLKLSLSGLAAIAVGNVKLPHGFNNVAYAAGNVINLTMMEADVAMFDNTQVYHWVFASDVSPVTARNSVRGLQEQVTPVAGPAGTQLFPSFPGPVIFATAGETITLNITNNLPANVPHAFQVVGTKIKTDPIPAGQTRSITFKVPDGGSYMYIDPLNAPINRVLGLHGALISLPNAAQIAAVGVETPYSKPTPNAAQIFKDLGTTPELPPNQKDVADFGRGGWFLDLAKNRFRIWFISSTDPTLNEEIRNGIMPTPAEFRRRYIALYQMMNGRSGGYASHHDIVPTAMIGQPILLRFLNAGMAQHSAHIHGNHVLVMAINNQVRDNIFSVDVWSIRPMDRVDWMLPFRMPPDIPNKIRSGANNAPAFVVPPAGNLATACNDELNLRPTRAAFSAQYPLQRPMTYPMHCHSEPSQAGAGGNYPGGLVTHWAIIGDINGVEFPPDPVVGFIGDI